MLVNAFNTAKNWVKCSGKVEVKDALESKSTKGDCNHITEIYFMGDVRKLMLNKKRH